MKMQTYEKAQAIVERIKRLEARRAQIETCQREAEKHVLVPILGQAAKAPCRVENYKLTPNEAELVYKTLTNRLMLAIKKLEIELEDL